LANLRSSASVGWTSPRLRLLAKPIRM
jgi:hypothetical protein